MLLVALFAFVFSANAGGGDGCCKKTECCKNCTDDNCKDTCTKISKMSKEEKKSAEGKKLIIACKAMQWAIFPTECRQKYCNVVLNFCCIRY